MKGNYIQELGEMAIGSRLKQLTEVFMKDLTQVYKELHVDFEPRWFTFVHLLSRVDKLPITEIAKRLNQTHVAANQVANALEKKKLIASIKDKKDQRKRILKLSAKGKKLVTELEPVWLAVEKAVSDLLSESESGLIKEIDKIEASLQLKSMKDRIDEQVNTEILSQVQILNYKPVHKHNFIDLNLAWLEEYFEVEDHDQKLLFNPDEEIIGKGGHIIMAAYKSDVVGTVALLKVNPTLCELTKMAVTEKFRGRGIGRKLLTAALDLTKQNGFQKVTLLTSPKLERAVNLYTSFGFTESKEPSLLLQNLSRCSIQLELKII